jgi:hypothetical protein
MIRTDHRAVCGFAFKVCQQLALSTGRAKPFRANCNEVFERESPAIPLLEIEAARSARPRGRGRGIFLAHGCLPSERNAFANPLRHNPAAPLVAHPSNDAPSR